jgi:hypothetical protein
LPRAQTTKRLSIICLRLALASRRIFGNLSETLGPADHVMLIEPFPTYCPPGGLSSRNITSTLPLMPVLSYLPESSWSTGVSQHLDKLLGSMESPLNLPAISLRSSANAQGGGPADQMNVHAAVLGHVI